MLLKQKFFFYHSPQAFPFFLFFYLQDESHLTEVCGRLTGSASVMAAARERWKGATGSGSEGRPSVCVVLPSDLACWPVVKELLLELQGRLINESISDQVIAEQR